MSTADFVYFRREISLSGKILSNIPSSTSVVDIYIYMYNNINTKVYIFELINPDEVSSSKEYC